VSAAPSIRGLALVMVGIGVAIGTAAGRVTDRSPVRSGDDFILAGDFHVHAAPGDGSLTPSELRREASRAGLDVIAITNHNQIAAAPLVSALDADNDQPIVLLGEEVTHPTYHLIAVGITRAVRPQPSVADAVAAIHAQRGVAIAAHPTRSFAGYDEAALAVVDGTEVAHPERVERYRLDYIATFARARQLNPHVAPIGSSDIHNSLSIGQCRTFVFTRERSARGVIEAIRAGRTVAEDERGRLFGDASLVARVRAAMPKVRTDPHRTWRRTALILTWIGVAGVLLF